MRTSVSAYGSSSNRRGDFLAPLIPGKPKTRTSGFPTARHLPVWALALWCGVSLAAQPRILAIDVTNVVHPITVEIITHGLEQAKQHNAAAVLIRLNTRGGMMDAARQIVQELAASPVPVITYVTPTTAGAASAGFLLLEAGDVAAMAPGTHAGTAGPLTVPNMDPVLREKLENDAAATLRAIAGKRGRNAGLAEETVLKSRSFTDQEALDSKLIDLVAASERELLAQLNGREVVRFDGQRQVLHVAGAVVINYEKTVRESLLSPLTDPNLALVLLVLGGLGIYVEFHSPGLIFPGVAGAVLVLLGMAAIAVLPINWLGAALIVLAFVLFVLEAKITSHGILGAGGAAAMVLGALTLIDSPVPEMRIRFETALAIALPFAFITTILLTLVLRARRNPVVTGSEGMIGEVAVAAGPLSPAGKVFVHGEYWDAISNTPVPDGLPVRVTGIERLTLVVQPMPKATGG
ncbi:MAG TPA: nodulation protein NfeD [Verrucomicrobiae bacterium]|nr:nodulation protein NfeD [Verrucomicrobiae bacterium]